MAKVININQWKKSKELDRAETATARLLKVLKVEAEVYTTGDRVEWLAPEGIKIGYVISDQPHHCLIKEEGDIYVARVSKEQIKRI